MHEKHDLDKLSRDIADALHDLPRPQAQTGGAAPAPLPDPDALAAQIRPHLTPEMAEAGLFGGGKGGGGAGGGKKPFNLGNFIKNLEGIYNGVAPLISIISGAFGKPITLPPITVPAPPTAPGATPATP